MGRQGIDIEAYLEEFAATEADVKAGKAKACTKHGCACGNVPLLLDAFYNDKSNKKWGKASWCKLGEGSYNQKYLKALKETSAPKKRAITEDSDLETFESIMASERKPRKAVGVTTKTETPKAKPAAKKRAPRKRTPRKKSTQAKSAA